MVENKIADKKEEREMQDTVTEEKATGKKQRRNEVILVGVIVILALLYFLWKAMAPVEAGAEVVVEVYGEEYARLPLNKDAELDIAYEGNHNQLVIKDGVASVVEASCPDGLCVHQADISHDGELIVCLPNQVLVMIEGGQESETDTFVK